MFESKTLQTTQLREFLESKVFVLNANIIKAFNYLRKTWNYPLQRDLSEKHYNSKNV